MYHVRLAHEVSCLPQQSTIYCLLCNCQLFWFSVCMDVNCFPIILGMFQESLACTYHAGEIHHVVTSQNQYVRPAKRTLLL